MLVGNNESATTKNVGKSLVISISMRMRRCDAGRIAQWSTSQASLEATGHWMPPLGECLRSIAPAATMVNKFVENTLNTNKTQRLTSNYGTFRALVISEKFIPPNRPSTQLIDATSFVPM